MEFNYVATSRTGDVERGTLSAASKDAVAKMLQARDLLIIAIEKKEGAARLGSTAGRKVFHFWHVSTLDKVIFARHLSIMIRSGLSLTEALATIEEQTASKRMQSIIKDIAKGVTNGETLTACLAKYPKAFTGVFIGMVQVGEASGTLERNLDYIASELEKDYELQRKVKSAMIYPIIVLIATFILGTGLTIFILPKLVKMFSTFHMTLPIVTKIFLAIANFLVAYGVYALIGVVFLTFLLRFLAKTKATMPFFHMINLHLPVVKHIAQNINLARFSRVLAILLKSGVTINESLAITASVLTNVHYRREVERAVSEVKKGKSLAAVLSHEQYISKMANRMIAVGERSGKLEESLFYLADFYEAEVNNATKNLSTVIEPVLLIVIGVILGFLAVAIISPIYQFTGSLQR